MIHPPDKREVNWQNIMNVIGLIFWAGPAIYIYLRLYFRSGDSTTNWNFMGGFLFFMLAFGFLLWATPKNPNSPMATKWLGIACVMLVAAIAVGMAAFPLSYSLYLYRIHQNSGLQDIPLSEVVNTTYPGDHFARETMIKTPTLNGEAELGYSEVLFWIDSNTLKITWPPKDSGLLQCDSLRYVDYVSNVKESYFGDYNSDIADMGSYPSTHAITVNLSIPQDDLTAPLHVTGHLAFDARYYIVVDRISDSGHSGHYSTDIGPLESETVTFWVYPKNMAGQIVLEREMYQHTTWRAEEYVIAGSALIPLIFMLVALSYKKKVGKII
jgi:hypothetical protein